MSTSPENTQLAVLPSAALARGAESAVWNALKEMYDQPSDDALGLVLDYCKARKLDPMKKHVHIVPVWSKKRGKMVESVWPSIQELRTTAIRTGMYAGCDELKLGAMVKTDLGSFKAFEHPEWAQFTVYRMVDGVKCAFVGPKVYFVEAYATAGKDDAAPNSMWAKRTWGQLEKCAEAAALRRAFPEESGLTSDEMFGRVLDDGGLVDPAKVIAAGGEMPAPAAGESRAKMPTKKKAGAAGLGEKTVEAVEPAKTVEAEVAPAGVGKAETVKAAQAVIDLPAEPPVAVAKEDPAAAAPVADADPVPAESESVVAKPEWPKTVVAKVTTLREAPVQNHPKYTSVKVALLGGGKCVLAGKEIDVAEIGRVAFDPEKPELAPFAKVSDALLQLTIEEQPSTSNPQKMNRVIIAADLADEF